MTERIAEKMLEVNSFFLLIIKKKIQSPYISDFLSSFIIEVTLVFEGLYQYAILESSQTLLVLYSMQYKLNPLTYL